MAGCASRQSFSGSALAIDTSQQTSSVRGTVKSAGESYGKIAGPRPSTFDQIVGPIAVKTTDETRPKVPPTTAPRVVKPSQYIASSSNGKLALAAIAVASARSPATIRPPHAHP